MSPPLAAAWTRLKLELIVAYVHRRTLITRRAAIARLNAEDCACISARATGSSRAG